MKKRNIIIVITIIILIISIINLNFYHKTFITRFIKDNYYLLINSIKKTYHKEEFIINESNEKKDLQEEINRLKEVLSLNETISNHNYVNATIIKRNTNYWYNTIIIDKGIKNGIKINDPAITKDGLVGKVIETTNHTSTIKLLSNDNYQNKISIKITDQDIYGFIKSYNIKDNAYLIEEISSSIPIKVGDTVYTSGLSEIYPSGIKIGTVKEITYDNYELNKSALVTPSVNFNKIAYITVII